MAFKVRAYDNNLASVGVYHRKTRLHVEHGVFCSLSTWAYLMLQRADTSKNQLQQITIGRACTIDGTRNTTILYHAFGL